MNPKSAKAKGRRLQQDVARAIRDKFNLHDLDVKSTPMGCTGADIMLSKKAADVFPYAVECKNKENMKAIFNYFEQAIHHTNESLPNPVCIIGKNRTKPLAVISLDLFLELVYNVSMKD